jgi:hypothetical protein
MDRLAEPRLDPAAQFRQGPGRDAVRLGIGAFEDDVGKACLLAFAQSLRRMALRPVPQTGDALGVIAQNPVAQRLAVHASSPGRLATVHPVERIGQRQKPARHAPILLPTGQSPKVSGPHVLTYLQRHGTLARLNAKPVNHAAPKWEITTESGQPLAGMRPCGSWSTPLIPTGADQYSWAQSRSPMEMIFQG